MLTSPIYFDIYYFITHLTQSICTTFTQICKSTDICHFADEFALGNLIHAFELDIHLSWNW